MSSLRLALKQSLQETGASGGADGSGDGKKKKRGPGRPRKHHPRQQPGEQPPRKRGRPRKDNASSANNTNSADDDNDKNIREHHRTTDEEDAGEFSSENEFSVEEGSQAQREDENDDDAHSHEDNNNDDHLHQDGHEEEEEEHQHQHQQQQKEDNNNNESEEKGESSSRENHSAAARIQSHWKKKMEKSIAPPNDDDDDGDDGGQEQSRQQQQPGKPAVEERKAAAPIPPSSAALSPKASPSTKSSSISAAAATASGKKPDSNKRPREGESSATQPPASNSAAASGDGKGKNPRRRSSTVVPPKAEVLDFMRKIPTKLARPNVKPGMRVKVRFATKVKREGKTVRKKKWFGGRISTVSKEGTKIRIKYDDGTSEVTKFPDKDVVVDETKNGEHQVSTEYLKHFLPPPELRSDDAENEELAGEEVQNAKEQSKSLERAEADVSRGESNEHLKAGSGRINASVTESEEAPPTPVKTEEQQPKPKRKRGRPPKHRPAVKSADPSISSGDSPKQKKKMTGQELSRDAIEAARASDTGDSLPVVPDPSLSTKEQPKEEFGVAVETSAKSDAEPKGGTSKPDQRGQRTSLTIRIPSSKLGARKSPLPAEENQPAVDGPETSSDYGHSPIKEAKKRSRDEADASGPTAAPKRLHIHIPASKSFDSSKDKSSVKDSIPSLVADGTKSNQDSEELPKRFKGSTENDDGNKSPIPNAPKTGELDLTPASPKSPRGRKKRKKMNAEDSVVMLPESTQNDGSTSLPKTTEFAKAEDPRPATPVVTDSAADIGQKSSSLITSQNSAFERKDDVPSVDPTTSTEDSSKTRKPTTPRPRPKQDNSVSIVRSGRRAAQQANERIVSKEKETVASAPGQEPLLKKKKKRRNKDGDENDSESSDDGSQWVQCDKCSKWRIIPSSAVKTLPAQWYCSLNTYDKKRASCDAPEQTAKQAAKEKKRIKKRKQRQIEAAAAGAEGKGNSTTGSESAKERSLTRSPRPRSPIPRNPRLPTDAAGNSSTKVRSTTPVNASPNSDSGNESNNNKGGKKSTSSSVGKKGRSNNQLTTVEENQTESKTPEVKRRPGRPRRNATQNKESDNGSGNGTTQAQADEADNLEWVQCDKCHKWRKLPPHISADELPEVWHCSMNTWNPAAARCEVEEDKADGLQDIGFGNAGAGANKLSYRNLIFGQTGRNQKRPISERTRAAESIFSAPSDDSDAPPTVMYANSTAFVSRFSKSNQTLDENSGMNVFELMSHSRLWQELRGNAQGLNGNIPGKPLRAPFYSFDTLPVNLRQSMKDLILHALGTQTLTGDEVLLEAQCRNWDNVPKGWAASRAYCSINVVVTALCDLVKEGVVECVQSNMGENWDISQWNPRYRRAKPLEDVTMGTALPTSSSPTSILASGDGTTRCMKISKPWKRV